MAQQTPFTTSDDGGDDRRQQMGGQTGRYSENAGANFVGGGMDAESGNLRAGSAFEANRGIAPTKPKPVETPAPAQPTSQLAKLDAPPPPQQLAPQPVAPYNPPKQDNTLSTIATVGIMLLGFFCYARGTLVRRADGSWVRVEDIDVGENLSLGGMVTAVGRAMTSDLYEYRGTKVSGSHAVFEDGRFVRVADSPQAIKLNHDAERELVYPVVTEKHLMVLETHIAADFSEVENGQEMTSAQRLEAMNGNADRLRILADIAGFHARAA